MAVSGDLHRLLYRIAQSYYLDGMTQQQIAKRFGLSRPKVSRLLQKARGERIVNITLVPPPAARPTWSASWNTGTAWRKWSLSWSAIRRT